MWIANKDPYDPFVMDDQTGQRIATLHRSVELQEPLDWAWSRACLVAKAPELFRCLADMLEHAKRQFPEHVSYREAEELFNNIRESYERGTVEAKMGRQTEKDTYEDAGAFSSPLR